MSSWSSKTRRGTSAAQALTAILPGTTAQERKQLEAALTRLHQILVATKL